jgi:hypothetical protein
MLDDRGTGVRFMAGVRDFLFYVTTILTQGSTQPPSQWVPGVSSPEVKRPAREADHSPSTAEVKNGGVLAPLPHMPSGHGAELIKHGDSTFGMLHRVVYRRFGRAYFLSQVRRVRQTAEPEDVANEFSRNIGIILSYDNDGMKMCQKLKRRFFFTGKGDFEPDFYQQL